MLAASLALLVLPACNECDSSLDPVKCTDLCEQSSPHRDCAKCQGGSPARGCPQCLVDDPPSSCTEDGGGSGGSAGTDSGNGGSGGNAGTVSGSGGVGGNGGTGGVVSGGEGGTTGGVGGTAAIDAGPPPSCEDDDNCEADLPLCSGGECSPCSTDDVCIAEHRPLAFCDDGTQGHEGACVRCRSHDDCEEASTRPWCFRGECSECATHSDCDDPEHPQCTNGVCVECTDEGQGCAMRGTRTHCDEGETSLTRGQCLECLEHGHCDNPEPQCNAGECGDCTDNDDACVGRGESGLTKCNTHADRTTTGQCVECTGDTGTTPSSNVCSDGTNNYSCDQDLGRCTGTRIDTALQCRTCVADSECVGSAKCVEHVIGSTSLGSFCFLPMTNACAGPDNEGVNPYSRVLVGPSIDGHNATYCLPPTSCRAYLDSIRVNAPACDDASQCGLNMESLEQTVCINVGTEIDDRCSYYCDTAYDCPAALPICTSFCRPE